MLDPVTATTALAAASLVPALLAPANPFAAGELMDAVNTVRTPDLRWGPCVDAHAQRHAEAVAASGSWRHSSMTALGTACDRAGTWATGQVMGRGYSSPETLLSGWMASPGHRRVVTSPTYRRIGVGTAQDRHGRWVVVVNVIRH